jgi:hypothetical protein
MNGGRAGRAAPRTTAVQKSASRGTFNAIRVVTTLKWAGNELNVRGFREVDGSSRDGRVFADWMSHLISTDVWRSSWT